MSEFNPTVPHPQEIPDEVINIEPSHEAEAEREFSLSFDKEKLTEALEHAPAQAREVIETVMRLPESITFSPGITLIVGENGSGKSSIGKAIALAREIASRESEGKSASLDDINRSSAQSVVELIHSGGPLTVTLAEAIRINPIDANTAFTEYVDYGRLHGVGVERNIEAERNARNGRAVMTSIKTDTGYQQGVVMKGAMEASDVPRFTAASSESDGLAEEADNFDKMFSSDDQDHSHQSSRQLIDRVRQDRRYVQQDRRERVGDDIDLLMLLDEPEVGLSPRRQMEQLKGMLLEDIGEGTVGIVPTNSVALFMDGSIPRIDLDYPERGIHYPEN